MKRPACFLVCALALVGTVSAQQRPQPDTIAADTVLRLTPGKAFYRSLLIPGWGQASVGSHVRGGTFFLLQTSSAYMMLKTMGRLGEARQVEDRRVAAAADSIRTLMAADTALNRILSDRTRFNAAVDSTPSVQRIRGLVRSRKSQRQDWVTYTIVFTLASGVDAFVAAHLADFPATIQAIPRGTSGAELQLSVPLGKSRNER